MRPTSFPLFFLQAAPRGVLQSEGLPAGDQEDGPPLDEGGFLCFSGELSTEKAARVRRRQSFIFLGYGCTKRLWIFCFCFA